MAKLARFPAILTLATMLVLSASCGQAPAATPDATSTALQALTVIASLPTAVALHPNPTSIAADIPEPSGTPIPTAAAVATASPIATMPVATVAAADYVVQAGDTLLSIALTAKVSMAAIMLANDINDTQVVKLGQVLHIPGKPTWPGENPFWFVYVVQSGEAVSTIATRFDVSIADLVRVNQLPDASAIRDGQRLVIPAITLRPAHELAPTTVHQVAATDPPAVAVAAALPQPTAPMAQPIHAASVAPVGAAASMASVAGAETFRAQLLALYNQARAVAGLAPLSISSILQSAAQLHAQDCAQRGYGSHLGSDGSDPRQRIARAGYPGHIYGENWAWGRSAAAVFDAWFNQEAGGGPHRSNILSPRYKEVGIGITASAGGFYFIADFGAL